MLLLIFAKLCLPLVQKVWVWWWIPNYQRKLEITPICQIYNFEHQELVMLDDGWMPAPQNYLFLSTFSRLDYSNSLLASCLDSCSHEFPHTQKSKCRCGINFQSATLPVNNSTIKSASLASCLMKSLLQNGKSRLQDDHGFGACLLNFYNAPRCLATCHLPPGICINSSKSRSLDDRTFSS